MAHREIGIEHMEAVPENHVRESIYRQQGIGPTVHILKKHQPGEVSRSNDSILTDIIQDKAGAPWVGNEVEIEWAKVMLHCIDAKNAALNKSGFTKFTENWLLIYNKWPLPGVHYDEAISLLANSIQNRSAASEYNRVFILDSRFLCEIGIFTRLIPVISPSAGT